ncbi:Citrate/succinate antiporter [Hafnia alvei]|uniref:Citrate/succinate antiporter n=1 Tax=Hafnia alvei TaxID=569 RepID=A0A377PDM8_HAFAL|nr:Citrate/succinate antiporter [Hafnia alvei]
MSVSKDKIWKLVAPLLVMAVMLLIPVPDGMPPQAWHYFAVFVAMIVGMILEPIPATAISFIAVTICVIGSNYLLFDAKELADPAFDAGKQALKWGLAGFSSTTVWLVFGAFIFALGYEVTGLGRRIALFMVKFMGKRTLTLGYAIVIIDIMLAPFTPSNTARTGGTVFPVIKNLPPLFKSFPNDPSSRRIGGYLMWMMVISTSLSSSMFVTGAAPNVLGLEFVSKIAGIQISWLQWFLSFLPVGLILLIVAPWLSYVLYKPEVTHSEEVSEWAGGALKEMGRLTSKRDHPDWFSTAELGFVGLRRRFHRCHCGWSVGGVIDVGLARCALERHHEVQQRMEYVGKPRHVSGYGERFDSFRLYRLVC